MSFFLSKIELMRVLIYVTWEVCAKAWVLLALLSHQTNLGSSAARLQIRKAISILAYEATVNRVLFLAA